jgi:ABC-type branched-subunit amino acid transport system substrate-binding protein
MLTGVFFSCSAKPYYLGTALPISGAKQDRGNNILAALKLQVETINKAGGVKGSPLELVVKDDKNDPEVARQVARELAQDPRVLGVIGHYDSPVALAAMEEYNKAGVVIFSPSVGSADFLSSGDWTFCGTYSDKAQAENMAVYAKNLFQATNALVLAASGIYGQALSQAFQAKAVHIGLQNKVLVMDEKTAQLPDDFASTAFALSKEPFNCVFVFSHSDKGIPAIRLLRDGGYQGVIFLVDRVGSDIIEKLELKYKKDVYLSFPFAFDLGDFRAVDFAAAYKEKTKTELSIWSAFAVDGLNLMVQGIERKGPDRTSIQSAFLEASTHAAHFPGMTGDLFFDKDGAMIRSSTVVRFSTPGDMFKPTYDQLKIVSDDHNLRQIDKKVKSGEFLLEDTTAYFRIQVVYVGLDYARVNSISPKEQSFNIDFYLWFRWTGELNTADLILANAFGDVSREKLRDDLNRPDKWESFKVRASFLNPFDLRKFPFDTQELPITVAHRNKNADKLVLVADRERIRSYPIKEIFPEEYIYVDRKTAGGIFEVESVFGNPNYRATENQAAFSQFHSALIVRRNLVPYLVTLFFPLGIIFVISLFSFLINKENFMERLNLFMTALLAVVVFQMAQGAEMPRLGYPVMADYYFMIAYGLLFFFILKTLYVNWLYVRNPGSTTLNGFDKTFDLVFILVGLLFYVGVTYIGLA